MDESNGDAVSVHEIDQQVALDLSIARELDVGLAQRGQVWQGAVYTTFSSYIGVFKVYIYIYIAILYSYIICSVPNYNLSNSVASYILQVIFF